MEETNSSITPLVALAFIAIVIFAIRSQARRSTPSESGSRHKQKPEYRYTPKTYIMTKRESQFFTRLNSILGDRYYIFPQVHLSSLLDHKVKNQNWKAALAKIQRKSVDYALVDKQTLITRYALELDDSTHNSATRIERDKLVDGIFDVAGTPLIRLRNVEQMSDAEIQTGILGS